MKNRANFRAAKSIERRAIAKGAWSPWIKAEVPKGTVGTGWCEDITETALNNAYVVLIRYLDGGASGRAHLAIRTQSNSEPPWRDLQRIKNELFGHERFAVQAYPPVSRLIDEA